MKTSISNNSAMTNQRSATAASGRGGGGGGGRPGHGGRRCRGSQTTSGHLSQDNVNEDLDINMDSSDKHNKFYNGATPWSPPPDADDSVFHAPAKQVEEPLVRNFTGTLEIGFSIGTMAGTNISVLIKRFLLFALKTYPGFRILPLEGGNQSIAYPNGIPTTKEEIDLYFQHTMVKYGLRGNINVTMIKCIGKMKDMHSAFSAYINKEKLYVSQLALGLVNTRIIGVFLQANPTLTF
jgi:hypothetical protein